MRSGTCMYTPWNIYAYSLAVPRWFILTLTLLTLNFTTEAVVTFEYEAQQEDELQLKVGDVIKDVQSVSYFALNRV